MRTALAELLVLAKVSGGSGN